MYTMPEEKFTGNQDPFRRNQPPRLCFTKIAIDTCGPFAETHGGSKYVLTVICMLSSLVEAFVMPDKTTVSVAKILLDEIIRRYSWPLEIVSDNGTEYVSYVIAQITQAGQIAHIKSSPFHSSSNGKVERSHKTMVSCLSKVANRTDWDQYISSFCSAINFSKGANTKYSPFYLVYHREPILPAHTILKPREQYYGEDYLSQAPENMHKAYYLVRKRIKKQAERNKAYLDQKHNVQDVEFKAGDPVFLKNNCRQDKLDVHWLPHY